MRVHQNRTRVLLVTSSGGDHWIFPKGHLEAGETAADAALRELWEEADVEGDILGSIGVARFRSGRDEIQVEYFLVRAATIGGPCEGRQHRWLHPARARRRLSFADTHLLLDKALAEWKARRRPAATRQGPPVGAQARPA
jgi:diadenosine hexaphosphate hydrolase (ATP-forming)